MKRSNSLVFAACGFIAAVLLVAFAKITVLLLVFGVGPVIVGSVVLAAALLKFRIVVWKAVLAIILSLPAYFLAFVTFAFVASFAQQHGVAASSSISDMGIDMLYALAAAITVSSLGLALLATLLSGYWSGRHSLLLLAAGLFALALGFAIRVLYTRILGVPPSVVDLWLFFGPLFAIGGSLTALTIGDQIQHAPSQHP